MAPPTADGAAKVRLVQLAPGLAGVVLFVLVLWLARNVVDVLLLFFLAVLLAVFLDALRDALRARLKLAERAAFALAVFIALLVMYGVGALLVPAVIDQTRQLVARLPDQAVAWQHRLSALVARVPALEPFLGPERQNEAITSAMGQAEGFLGGLVPRVFDLLTGFIDVVSVLVMGLYLAMHPKMYEDFIVSVTPPRYRLAVRDVLLSIVETLRAWSLAQLIAMTVLGVLTAIGLWALDVPYALTFGMFTGVAAIVPFFGTLVSTLLPALFVLGGSGGASGALFVLLLGVGVHLVEGNFVEPLVMQRNVNLPPVFSIMAVLVLGKLFGAVGLLVAVPLLAVVMVLVRKVLIERVYGDAGTTEEKREDVELGLVAPAAPAAGISSTGGAR
ncbi:MAG: AI-2E family transporter [Gemmatimonadales bacterium]